MQKAIVIDIGNSTTKIAWFLNGQVADKKSFNSEVNLSDLENDFDTPIIISAVGNRKKVKTDDFSHVLEFNHLSKIPIQNQYHTPETLGLDRLAVAIAVANHENALVIDLGTCITFDFIDQENNYQGGYIIPGVQMRFKAMNNFTDKLPLIEDWKSFKEDFRAIGKSTKESMLYGVLFSVHAELEQMIKSLASKYGEIKVYLTGGDADFFDLELKSSIFADENLVLQGLYKVLLHNQ